MFSEIKKTKENFPRFEFPFSQIILIQKCLIKFCLFCFSLASFAFDRVTHINLHCFRHWTDESWYWTAHVKFFISLYPLMIQKPFSVAFLPFLSFSVSCVVRLTLLTFLFDSDEHRRNYCFALKWHEMCIFLPFYLFLPFGIFLQSFPAIHHSAEMFVFSQTSAGNWLPFIRCLYCHHFSLKHFFWHFHYIFYILLDGNLMNFETFSSGFQLENCGLSRCKRF